VIQVASYIVPPTCPLYYPGGILSETGGSMITTHYYLHMFVCNMLMLQLSGHCLLSRDSISGDFTEIVIAPGIRMTHPFFLSKRQISSHQD